MKILFVAPEIPHIYSGGASRMFYMIKHLSKIGVKVHLLSYYDKQDIGKIGDYCEKIYLVKNKQNPVLERMKNLFLLRAYTYSSEFMRKVSELNLLDYDVIQVEKFQMAGYFIHIKNIPVIIDLWAACGIKGSWYEFWYEKDIIQKLIKFTRLPRLYLAELKNYKNFRYYFTVSKEAKEYILNRYPYKKVYIVPTGIEIEKFTLDNDMPNKNLIFTGDMSFFQNVDTVLYFVKKIYPSVKAKIPDVKFYIVGKNPAKEIIKLAEKDNSIIVTGFVENIYEYLNNSSIFVAPIRSGAGIRTKILEALACGLPVIATRKAFEGIDIGSYYNLLTAEHPNEFSQKIISFLKKTKELITIKQDLRKIIEEKYKWDKIAHDILQYYNEIINDFKIQNENRN